MSDAPVELIVAAFDNEERAKQALERLKAAHADGLVQVQEAAVLRKDQDGKLHVNETSDWGTGRGAAIGGVVGGAIGLIAGPALLVPAGVGALIGGLSAKWRDSSQRDDQLTQLGADLKSGSSAIVALVGPASVEEVRAALREAGGESVVEELGADIAEQLESDHDVAYRAIVSEEGIRVGKVTAGDEDVAGRVLVADESGVAGGQFVATEDGFAVRAVDVDAETGQVTVRGLVVAHDPEWGQALEWGAVAVDAETGKVIARRGAVAHNEEWGQVVEW